MVSFAETMPDFVAEDVFVGLRCMAPVRRAGQRALENVELTWVSRDGAVVEGQTYGTRARPQVGTFARTTLKRSGTPSGQVVL